MQKTQAMRLLDARGIAYSAIAYDASGEFHSGAEAASLLGVEPSSVYKTLVVLREDQPRARPLLVMIPAVDELDLKRLARAVDAKKLCMATQKEAERLTGLRVGGISALAVRPGTFDVLIDERASSLANIHVSAGQRGLDLELNPSDLAAITSARLVSLE
jgi:Cys-tRNA(Pro)/Cys-tRNA(Cys) deacylase